jgi:hypothetical protein
MLGVGGGESGRAVWLNAVADIVVNTVLHHAVVGIACSLGERLEGRLASHGGCWVQNVVVCVFMGH